MAGGMSTRGGGIPLGQRRRTGAQLDSRLDSQAAPVEPAADCPVRHCWVADADDRRGAHPGLLVEWRRGRGRWEGRVVYAASLRPGEWALVESWLPAELLSPR